MWITDNANCGVSGVSFGEKKTTQGRNPQGKGGTYSPPAIWADAAHVRWTSNNPKNVCCWKTRVCDVLDPPCFFLGLSYACLAMARQAKARPFAIATCYRLLMPLVDPRKFLIPFPDTVARPSQIPETVFRPAVEKRYQPKTFQEFARGLRFLARSWYQLLIPKIRGQILVSKVDTKNQGPDFGIKS